MKLFIVSDIEGIAGVMRPQQCQPGNVEYERARALMEGEVNAAIEGALEAGATRIVVADSHGPMTNLRAEEIHPAAELVQGKPREFSMAHGLADDDFDAIAFVGLHSPAGVEGVLAHTINGRAFHRVEINDQLVGESDLYAAYAAEMDIPLVFASGDDRFGAWITAHHPNVSPVVVKKMEATRSACSLSPQKAREHIREGIKSALGKMHGVTKAFSAPYHLRLTTTQPALADAFAMLPNVERLDAQMVGFTAPRIGEVIALLGAASLLSGSIL